MALTQQQIDNIVNQILSAMQSNNINIQDAMAILNALRSAVLSLVNSKTL